MLASGARSGLGRGCPREGGSAESSSEEASQKRSRLRWFAKKPASKLRALLRLVLLSRVPVRVSAQARPAQKAKRSVHRRHLRSEARGLKAPAQLKISRPAPSPAPAS